MSYFKMGLRYTVCLYVQIESKVSVLARQNCLYPKSYPTHQPYMAPFIQIPFFHAFQSLEHII